jgi:class 3 adenylate cyclase
VVTHTGMTRRAPDAHDGQKAAGLEAAFSAEARRGALLAIAVYALWSAALAVSGILGAITTSGFPGFFKLPASLLLQGIGAVLVPVPIYVAAMRSKSPLAWCFVSMILDILIWAQGKFFWFSMPPFYAHVPLFLEVRYSDVISFMILLTIYILPLSRSLIAWGGASVLLVWTAGIIHAYSSYPGAALYWGPLGSAMDRKDLHAMMNPEVLVPDFFVIQLFLVAAYVGFLALSIRRARRYVIDRVGAERDSAFLERFFPPDIAKRIGDAERLEPALRQVAILFTKFQDETGPPAEQLPRMQSGFADVERIVFSHGGILDRFTGGPIMATFGSLGDDANSAERALLCSRAIMNKASAEVRGVFMALHAGAAICGDVGGTHSRLFSVVGDVVNTTRRILDAAEARGRSILASREFIEQALRDDAIAADCLGQVALRGRDAPMELWEVHA